MGMPRIELTDIDLDVALNNLVGSIALEEAALAHIMNAEGEKIQKVISMEPEPGDEEEYLDNLIEINRSVKELMANVAKVESALANKLEVATQISVDDET